MAGKDFVLASIRRISHKNPVVAEHLDGGGPRVVLHHCPLGGCCTLQGLDGGIRIQPSGIRVV